MIAGKSFGQNLHQLQKVVNNLQNTVVRLNVRADANVAN